MWQVCPLCKGEGYLSHPLSDTDMGFMQGSQFRFSNDTVCTVCNGKKIISEITGLPPSTKPEYEVDPNKTNTTDGNLIST